MEFGSRCVLVFPISYFSTTYHSHLDYNFFFSMKLKYLSHNFNFELMRAVDGQSQFLELNLNAKLIWINMTFGFPCNTTHYHQTWINSVIKPASPPSPPLFSSAICLISLICSNRILISVFSLQTLHSTGGEFQCTFHLYLMAGPSGIPLMSPLPHACCGLSLPFPPLRVVLMLRVNGLKLRLSLRYGWFSVC